MNSRPVLITWVAINNDPYERDRETGDPRLINGKPVFGPTLTLLCDEESPYVEQVEDVVLLHRSPERGMTHREKRAIRELHNELRERSFRVHLEPWGGDDPTDHNSVFEFLRDKLPELRRRFSKRELILHISPGTPSMHTVWVLMAETGFVDPPFKVVKSYRQSDRRGRPAVVPVELGLDTFYKTYKASLPRQVSSEEQSVLLDPGRFQSETMKRVYREARRFAQLNVPILIRGERGTGKTTLASWIRSNSPFKREELNTRWPSVACGQYSPETMRAELFGYKAGAFTGATTDREGLLAAADQDTLFLDEVGDVSPDLQRLLIKAIEEKKYFPLGDDKAKESNFRLITATNLEDTEIKNRLHPDFLDRISLLTLTLPPLREIREDLHWLWEAVYQEASKRAGVSTRRALLSSGRHDRIVEHLQSHSLPGNLRDLFRVAYRILAARNDAHEPMSPKEAVLFGVEALQESSSCVPKYTTVSRMTAAAFANSSPIDELLSCEGFLNTTEIIDEFKSFIAIEIRRISKTQGVKGEEICDVTERSLRKWAQNNPGERKKNSSIRKKYSEKDEG